MSEIAVRVSGLTYAYPRGPTALDGVSLTTADGYRLHAGDQFTIVDNDGSDPVTGTLSNLPEGAIVQTRGGDLRLSYRGGDGNG